MVVHQIFAIIVDEDIKNIIVCENYELANQLSRALFGENAFAEECTQYPVSIGDKFKNRTFYFKDGVTVVPRLNTAEEDALQANEKVEQLRTNQVLSELDIDFRLSMIELGLI